MSSAVVVLLADDDEPIRQTTEEALLDAGFAVEQAARTEGAISMLEAGDAAYAALVTDINQGRGQATGWDTLARGRQSNPALAVVYMTGEMAAASEGGRTACSFKSPGQSCTATFSRSRDLPE